MAAPESPETIARQLQREQVTASREREADLEGSLAPFRVGSVEYLNAVPLTRGIEDQIVFTTPARLAELLRRDELDAALVSITEVLFNDRYDILDGIAIASLGEVYSVLLAHKKPLKEAKEIFCDTASLTSVNLLKVLLAERGLKPEFKPLENYEAAADKDFVLLIGDKRQSLFNYNCGACGYRTCAELNKAEMVESLTSNGPSCIFRNINIHMAADAAAAMAWRLGLHCRVFSTLAFAAKALDIMPDVDIIVSIAVSAAKVDPFFDRHKFWTQEVWDQTFSKEFPTFTRGFIGAVEEG